MKGVYCHKNGLALFASKKITWDLALSLCAPNKSIIITVSGGEVYSRNVMVKIQVTNKIKPYQQVYLGLMVRSNLKRAR